MSEKAHLIRVNHKVILLIVASELKLKYKQLSTVRNEWFKEIKMIFICSRNEKWDVIIVTDENKIYGYGHRVWCVLRYDKETVVLKPTIIPELFDKCIKKVEFGDKFIVFLTENFEVLTGGWCLNGRSGNGVVDDIYYEPMKINTGGKLIVDIQCCKSRTVLLTDTQEVYAFGCFTFDEKNSILTPTLINSLENVKITAIPCGYDHTLALSDKGKVYSWGYNGYGQLGQDDTKKQERPSYYLSIK